MRGPTHARTCIDEMCFMSRLTTAQCSITLHGAVCRCVRGGGARMLPPGRELRERLRRRRRNPSSASSSTGTAASGCVVGVASFRTVNAGDDVARGRARRRAGGLVHAATCLAELAWGSTTDQRPVVAPATTASSTTTATLRASGDLRPPARAGGVARSFVFVGIVGSR